MEGWAQLITSIATLLATVGVLIQNRRTAVKVEQVAGKVEQVHQATNGLTAKLVASTAVAAKAEGNLEGRAELKVEQAVDPLDNH